MNTQVESDTTKRQVAKHSLLFRDAAGNVKEVENFEDANGNRYTDIQSGTVIDYFPEGKAKDMLALFGGRTLMTNEASAVRNSKEGGDSAQQVAAIQERFQLLDSGIWVDRTREVGATIDKAKMASAGVEVLIAQGQVEKKDEAEWYEKLLKRLEEEKGFLATLRGIQGVPEAYARLVGKATKTAADLMKTFA